MTTLVLAEHDNSELKQVTLNVVKAASEVGGDINILIAGCGCQKVAEAAAKIEGVNTVIVADSDVYSHQLAENMALLITDMAEAYSHIMAAATTNGKNIMPRVAALLDVDQLSDITSVENGNTFKRPIYAGNAIATVRSNEAKHVITVRGTGFDAVSEEGGCATIESVSAVLDAGVSKHVSDEIVESDRPDLSSARVIVSGGRGMGNASNFKMLDGIADKLEAGVGASRAAVDAGFAPNDMQIGQTGKIVAPELYIAVGISGAIQHLAGMKDSKVIVAINKDEEAPIFQVADYGLVGDLFEALPVLNEKL